MRNISAASLATLSQSEGVEPINFIEVRWRGTSSRFYSDQGVPGALEGKILELSNLENVVDIAGSGTSQEIMVKLDDTDGSIKNIMDNVDIHKTPVFVYQWFKNLPLSDAFIIFEGEISTPIIWSEPERTVSFSVLSKLTDSEIGFSAEEGDFDFIPPNLIGKAWPLVFGTALRVPALRANDVPSGATTSALGVTNKADTHFANIKKNNDDAYNKAKDMAIICLIVARDALATADRLAFEQRFANILRANNVPNAPTEDLTSQIEEMRRIADEYNNRSLQYVDQMNEIQTSGSGNLSDPSVTALEKPSVDIVNGDQFPQQVPVSINIGGGVHEGVFNGNTFVITKRNNPFADDLGIPEVGPMEISENIASQKYQSTLSNKNAWVADGGSMVNIHSATNYPMTYVASLMWTTIPIVWAYRTFGGFKTLAVVPTNRYVVQHLNFNGLQATIVRMPAPLSSYINEGWEDDIYCDITSPIGPNVVDIMAWVIQNYTDHNWDPTTFLAVKTKVAAFPANFSISQRPNVVQFLQDIAYQSRCAIWYSNGVFYLKYLPDDSAPVDTITDSDVEFGSLEMTCTPTEELITKYTATWQEDGTKQPYKIIFRQNVQKYGTHAEEHNFYIYNVQWLVEKSALFWLIRKSNTWKQVKFTTFLTKLKLEPYDMVTLNLSNNLISNGPVTAMVKTVQYDSDNNRITVELWVPVRFGEMVQYPFAMPANVSGTIIFPRPQDLTGGRGFTAGGQILDQTPHVGKGTQKFSRAHVDRGASSPEGNVPVSGVVQKIRDAMDKYFDPGYVPVSDAIDQPSTIARTFNPPSITPGFTLGNRTPVTMKQWTIKEPPPVNLAQVKPGVFPGFVRSQADGNKYICDVYYQGLDGKASSITCRQIDQAEGDSISPDTPVIILRNVWTEGEGELKIEHTICSPIWLPEIKKS